MKPDVRIFHVAPHEANQTLATALRAWLGDAPSWSDVRRLVRGRQVQINGNLCLDAGRRLKPAEVVRVLPHPAAPPPREDDVRIRYVDSQLVVVEKPAGMTSVRHAEEQHWPARRKQLQPTLEDLLPRILAKKRGSPPARGGRQAQSAARTPPVRPVHRLDRETSGLMVFARTVPAERHLGEQFRGHTTGRSYLAIALGQVSQQTIESQLVRDRGDGRRGSTPESGVGKRAVTHIEPLEALAGYTLIRCRLETGRTHQIRIHLADAGHPLCGEKVYNKPLRGAIIADSSAAPRLALHAAHLSLKHPETNQVLSFEMPLPDDLAKFLERLRQASRRTTGLP